MQDANAMEAQLQGIKYFNRILQINLAKYDRQGMPLEDSRKKAESTNKPKEKFHNPPAYGQPPSKFNSFLDALTGKKTTHREKIITIDQEEESLMKPWFSSSLVARAKQLSTVEEIHSLASSANVQHMQVRYLGGLFLLLSFPSQKVAETFLKATQVWEDWFSKMEQWRGQSIPYERIAWLRIHGVPPHLWNPSVFNKIGSSYCRLLRSAEAKWEDRNLSYECVGVLVNNATPVNDNFILRWSRPGHKYGITGN